MSGWLSELRRFILILAVAAAAGWAVGLPVAFPLAGIFLYLLIHLYRVDELARWLFKPKRTEVPDAGGIWGQIYGKLFRLRRQRQRRKKQLKRMINRFKEAAEATPDAAVTLGAGDHIEWLNAAATQLLGLRSPRDIGHPVQDLLRMPDFREYLTTGRYDEALEIASPVGEQMRLSIRITPYGDARKLLLARDITRLYRLENVRRDFVANVSHELRSPLTVIKGYVETLSDGEVPDEWRQPVDEVSRQTERMCRIVEDLLQLARIENDPGGAVRDPVPVTDILESICAEARAICRNQRDIELHADEHVTLLGDYNQLRSAFSNLIFNAIKYTSGGDRVEVRWEASEEGATLSVADTGVGIEAQYISRLTERFYRVDKARSRELGGTGLGLAIVKHTLMRHDAQLDIESEPEEGSTFRCKFTGSRVVFSEVRENVGSAVAQA